MGLAFSITIQGDLDGTTPFVWPSSLPDPVDGVHRIDAGVGVDVGRIQLDSLFSYDTVQGYWLRAFYLETSAATQAVRSVAEVPFQRTIQPSKIHSDLGTAPAFRGGNRFFEPDSGPSPGLRTFFDQCLLPPGAAIQLLNDDAGIDFAGNPVAGPHICYFEVEPIRTSKQYSLAQQISQAAARATLDGIVEVRAAQTNAGSLTQDFIIGPPLDRAQFYTVLAPPIMPRGYRPLQLRDIYFSFQTTPAAGESMVYTVDHVQPGQPPGQIATWTLDNTSGLAGIRRISNAIDGGSNIFDPGDLIRVTRTYVPGGGPAPLGRNEVFVRLVPFGY